jgi:cysteine desulfurase / selenocysteine lyase
MTVPLDVERIRSDFPILQTRLHADKVPGGVPLAFLDNAASTQRPRQVIQTISHVFEHDYANVHRGIHTLSERSTELYEAAREKVRAFIHAAECAEVIFTRGTTEGINLVARSWGDEFLKAGAEILLTEMEHHANIVPWHQVAARTGALVRFLPISDEGRLDLDQLDSLLTERTKIVAVTAVSNVLGTINPLKEIIARAHAVGAIVLVDAAQSVPHLVTDVQKLGCDFLAFSGHKMLGPTGIGVLYGRRPLLEKMPPFLGGGSMIRRVRLDGFEPAELPAKFEAGTPPIVEAIALGAAIDYLDNIGLDAVHAHEVALASLAHQRLGNVSGIRFIGPPAEEKSGIVSFTIDGVHAHDIAQVLDHHGVAIRAGHHCTMPLHKRLGIVASARASFYLYNTVEEVQQLGAAVEAAQRKLCRKRFDSTSTHS